MRRPSRKIAFVLAATEHGPLIVSRFDRHQAAGKEPAGVGFQLLERGRYEPDEVELTLGLLLLRLRLRGPGVVAVDGGANVGVMAVEWGRAMTGWGRVLAYEAQERLFYALAGNVALANCFNVVARHAALGRGGGRITIPVPDYGRPGSVSSLELRERPDVEFIGQPIDRANGPSASVECIAVDALGLRRLDLLKLDIEGMEMEALEGAERTLRTLRPIVLVEWLKADAAELHSRLDRAGYAVFEAGFNLLAVHREDPTLCHVETVEGHPGGLRVRLAADPEVRPPPSSGGGT